MVIPSLDQEITADLVLAQMVLRVDASLPIAVIKILLLSSSRVFVIQDTLAPDVRIVPLATSAILQRWAAHASLADVTTILI